VCVPRSESGGMPLFRSSRGSEIIAQRCVRMISLQAEGSFSCFIGIKDTRSRKQLKQNQKSTNVIRKHRARIKTPSI
jgi:hypothetical protein